MTGFRQIPAYVEQGAAALELAAEAGDGGAYVGDVGDDAGVLEALDNGSDGGGEAMRLLSQLPPEDLAQLVRDVGAGAKTAVSPFAADAKSMAASALKGSAQTEAWPGRKPARRGVAFEPMKVGPRFNPDESDASIRLRDLIMGAISENLGMDEMRRLMGASHGRTGLPLLLIDAIGTYPDVPWHYLDALAWNLDISHDGARNLLGVWRRYAAGEILSPAELELNQAEQRRLLAERFRAWAASGPIDSLRVSEMLERASPLIAAVFRSNIMGADDGPPASVSELARIFGGGEAMESRIRRWGRFWREMAAGFGLKVKNRPKSGSVHWDIIAGIQYTLQAGWTPERLGAWKPARGFTRPEDPLSVRRRLRGIITEVRRTIVEETAAEYGPDPERLYDAFVVAGLSPEAAVLGNVAAGLNGSVRRPPKEINVPGLSSGGVKFLHDVMEEMLRQHGFALK